MEIVVLTYSCSLIFTFCILFLLCFVSISPSLVSLKEMEASKAEGKRVMNEAAMEEEEEQGEDDENKKRRALSLSGKKGISIAGSTQPSCQVEDCTADMKGAKPYHRRHKVCEYHSKASVVLVGGFRQRFCQQCSRFHDLSEFDEAKRSCRRRLAGHNERRRKSSYDSRGEG